MSDSDTDLVARFKERARLLKIIHVAMLGGVVLVAAVAILLGGNVAPGQGASNHRVLLFVGLGLVMSGTVGASVIGQALGRKVAGTSGLDHALQLYQQMVIVRLAMLEGGALFMCVVVLLTGDFSPLALVAVCLVIMYRYRPNEAEFIRLARGAAAGGTE